MSGKIVARTMLHSSYVEDIGNGVDACIVSEIIEDENGVTQPNLRVFKNPQTKFWITQPQFRDHTDKIEFGPINLLDEYQVPYREKDREIYRALNNGFSPNYMSHTMKREVLQSPYVYGANITIEARVAMKYKKDLLAAGRTPHQPTTGFFDIEMSLLKGSYGKLPLMVFSAENQVYLAMKKGFMTEMRDGKRVDVQVQDIVDGAHAIIDPLVQSIFDENKGLKENRHKLPFQYHFFVADTEVEMIQWIFGKMHESKVSFIGVWNIGFDLPEILKVLDEAGIPYKDIFSDPNLKTQGFGYASFREDKRKVDHFTQKWHWLTATAHFQFVDSMALYSYIRTVDGKESSYALDDILKKFGIGGKLKIEHTKDLEGLQTADWHRVMLSKHFTSYALYAMWDAISLQILEWLNNDLTAMMLQCDITPPKFFPNQTIRVTNRMFEEWLPDGALGKIHGGHILGTGVDIEGLRDDELGAEGGAVLQPQDLVANGAKLFIEWPNHATRVYLWSSDLDFSAQYPSNIILLNMSKQTKIATLVNINAPWMNARYTPKDAVEVFCSYMVMPNANGVEIGVDFFDLPDYGEMGNLFTAHLQKAA